MVALRKPHYITPQEYLEGERQSEIKHEYHDGKIVAMAGASPEHNAIVYDLTLELGPQLRHRYCQGFSSDLRVWVPACNKYYYPDGVVVCGEPLYQDVAGMRSLLNPTLLIEVLSESTAHTDHSEKFDCYSTLDTLQTYVLVAQDSPRIENYTRQEDGTWRYTVARGMDCVLTLDSIGCALRLSEVYARIAFPPPSPPAPDELIGEMTRPEGGEETG
jgi:Uma2 family endonuclease